MPIAHNLRQKFFKRQELDFLDAKVVINMLISHNSLAYTIFLRCTTDELQRQALNQGVCGTFGSPAPIVIRDKQAVRQTERKIHDNPSIKKVVNKVWGNQTQPSLVSV